MKLKLLASLMLIFTAFSCAFAADSVSVAAPSSAEIGQPFVVTVTASADYRNVNISWQGKDAALAPIQDNGKITYMALLGTDLKNAKAGTYTLSVSCMRGSTKLYSEHQIELKTHAYPSENLTVAPNKLNPPKEIMRRIEEEAKLGRAAMRSNTPGSAPALPLVRPVPGGLSSVYGKSRYLNGEFKGRHGGLDMRAKPGTPVKAAANGMVVLTGDFWFAGKCVYIDHGAGIVSFYGHMSKIMAAKGHKVKAGDIIGLSGQTGRVTGPHLHFGLAWRGEFFDPSSLME
ncbi:MAG: M23 family metallopeptidase [Synergistaceae bacterium]|nr:M23 family metallopeptidase [Synergistaceae bacterium]